MLYNFIEYLFIIANNKNKSIFVKSFSLKQNLNDLFDFEIKSKSNLKCLHGLKVLSLSWVILGHTAQWPGYIAYSKLNILRTL